MITRYLNRIGTLQLKPPPAFKHGGSFSLAFKPKFKSTTTSKHKTKSTTTSKHKTKPITTFKDELHNVKIRTRRSPSNKEPESSSHVNKILASDAFKHRAFGYAINSGDSTKSTIVRFYEGKDKDGNLEKGSLPITFDFGLIRIPRNSDNLRQAASTLARFLERWPHTIDFGIIHKKVFVDVALEGLSSMVSKIYPKIDFDPSKPMYWSTVDGIDPDSGKSYSVFVAVRPKNITNLDVPETPKTEVFDCRETSRFHPQSVEDATQKRAPTSPISDEDTSDDGRKHKAAIKVLQLVLWKYHNKLLRLSDVQYATEEIVLKYAARTQGSRGPYESKPLYTLFSSRVGEYDFRPSLAVSRDTFPKLPSIILVGSRAPSIRHVGDTIISTWISTGDLKRSWLAGWEAAQIVNKEVKAGRGNTNDKDWANWTVSKKPLNIRTLRR